jgi:hypothetical protein
MGIDDHVVTNQLSDEFGRLVMVDGATGMKLVLLLTHSPSPSRQQTARATYICHFPLAGEEPFGQSFQRYPKSRLLIIQQAKGVCGLKHMFNNGKYNIKTLGVIVTRRDEKL